MALAAGSPVIDTEDPDIAPAADKRGASRAAATTTEPSPMISERSSSCLRTTVQRDLRERYRLCLTSSTTLKSLSNCVHPAGRRGSFSVDTEMRGISLSFWFQAILRENRVWRFVRGIGFESRMRYQPLLA
jgi:hypothetical protein